MATRQQKEPLFLAERMPEALAERLRQSDLFAARMFLLIMLGAWWFTLLAILLVGNFELARDFATVTLFISIGIVLAIFVLAMGRYAKKWWTGSNVPAVEYCVGTLTLRARRHGIYIAKVKECHFWVGPAHYMTFGMADYMIATRFVKNRFASLADRDVILIEILPLYKTFGFFGRVRGYTTAAVGYTDETFAQWVNLLGDAIQGPPGPSEYANQTYITSLDPQSWE